MRGFSSNRQRSVHASPASLLEALEPRVHLSAFVYTSVLDYLGGDGPLLTLRPAGENAAAKTIASAVAAAGDIDGDGVPDILVGSGGQADASDTVPTQAVAAIFSGATGQLLRTFSDGFTEFGASVAGVGDVNDDGVPDVLVGSPRWDDTPDSGGDAQIGRAYLYSGADGALLRTFTGEAPGDRFGAAVALAGDVNNDGTPDVIIGAPDAAGGGIDRGAASIYSGADGTLIRRILGLADGSRFGSALGGAGDLNGDGFDDVIIGAPGSDSGPIQIAGAAYGFSGADGSLFRTLVGAHARDLHGFAVAGGSDATGDGVPDLIVGAPSFDGAAPNGGRVALYSGATGELVREVIGDRSNSNLGASVAFAGDFDFDLLADLLVGQPAANPDARVVIVSSATGAQLGEYVARDRDLIGSDRLGTSIAPVGDINDDGVPDFAFAGTQDARPGRNDRSRMYVFSGASVLNLLPTGIDDRPVIWGTVGSEGFLIFNGEMFVLPSRGFSRGDRVIDVNHSNVVLGGRDLEGHDPFVWEDGVRRTLVSMITTYDGPTADYIRMRAVDITDSGRILVERTRADEVRTTWVFENGTLRYLHDGQAVGINEAGWIVSRSPTVAFRSILRAPDGTTTELEGIAANDINEANTVSGSGHTSDGPGFIRTVYWQNGQLTMLQATRGGNSYFPHSMNDAGWIVGRYTTPEQTTSGHFFDPVEGVLMDIRDITVPGAPEAFTGSSLIRLEAVNNEGLIVGRTLDSQVGFILSPSGRGPARAMPGSRVSASDPASNSMAAITLNLAGEILSFRRDPATGGWTAFNLTGVAGAPLATDAVTFMDPATGRAAYAAVADDGFYLVTENDDGSWSVRNLTAEAPDATAIVRGLTTFTSLGGVAFLAGIDASGDVVIYRQTGETNDNDARVWAFENLSETHLRPAGLTSPAYEGPLVAYVTTWDGLNIAGLDENGNIWTVWTAPALGGRWESSNLSEITGAPVLVGGLAPFLAPWSAIHIAGTDSNGDTVVTWWVPDFGGNWEKNNLTQENGFERLRPESVSSFVTSWGALNIVGLDDEGEVSTYWWVPETNQWQLARLDLERPDREIRPTKRLDGFATRDSAMSLFGTGPNGEVLRLHWRPDQPWLFENLTAAVR